MKRETKPITETLVVKDFRRIKSNHQTYIDSNRSGCLRIADTILRLGKNRFRIIRSWLPGKWNPDLYPTK